MRSVWILLLGVGCDSAADPCLDMFPADDPAALGDPEVISGVEAECVAAGPPCTVSVTPEAAACVAHSNGLPEGPQTSWLVYHHTFETAVWNIQVVLDERPDGMDGQVASVDAGSGEFLGLSEFSASY